MDFCRVRIRVGNQYNGINFYLVTDTTNCIKKCYLFIPYIFPFILFNFFYRQTARLRATFAVQIKSFYNDNNDSYIHNRIL